MGAGTSSWFKKKPSTGDTKVQQPRHSPSNTRKSPSRNSSFLDRFRHRNAHDEEPDTGDRHASRSKTQPAVTPVSTVDKRQPEAKPYHPVIQPGTTEHRIQAPAVPPPKIEPQVPKPGEKRSELVIQPGKFEHKEPKPVVPPPKIEPRVSKPEEKPSVRVIQPRKSEHQEPKPAVPPPKIEPQVPKPKSLHERHSSSSSSDDDGKDKKNGDAAKWEFDDMGMGEFHAVGAPIDRSLHKETSSPRIVDAQAYSGDTS